MRKLTGVQIAYIIFWSICLVAAMAGLLLGVAGVAAGFGWPISLFGWAVPNRLPGIFETLFSWLGLAVLVWIIFGEKIKNYWSSKPKVNDVWADGLLAMREHKLIKACVALVLFGWICKLVVYLLYS